MAKTKLDLQSLVPSVATHEELLLKSGMPASAPAPVSGADEQPTKIRFTNTMLPETWLQLQQLAYWGRKDIGVIIDNALTEYFAKHPDSQRELPQDIKRKKKIL